MAKEAKAETFEQIYARLEETVGKLEQGGLPLEQAIALYEEGMTLARRCQDQLDGAEQKITKLKESFAALPDRDDGRQQFNEEPADYEYVATDDSIESEPLETLDEDPFA